MSANPTPAVRANLACFLPIVVAFALATELHSAEYHVAINGSDSQNGTQAFPLRTIQQAANLAQPGDVITVHAGVYRERVNPPRGGTSDKKRIVYQAAPGEKVTITGAEPLKGWEKVGSDTWKVIVPNPYFGNFNPFSHKIQGEWCEPTGRHAGSVYLNGEWLTESLELEPVLKAAGNLPLWFAEVGVAGDTTTIWAQFPGVNPNEADVEISKRQSVFYPSKTGINYITVRGFELCRAATPWGGAMSEQVGLIGTHWSKGWVIESNHIHHSMCKGVALGRYELPPKRVASRHRAGLCEVHGTGSPRWLVKREDRQPRCPQQPYPPLPEERHPRQPRGRLLGDLRE